MSDPKPDSHTYKWLQGELRDQAKIIGNQQDEIERLTEIKDLAVKDCMAEAAENECLQARVEELEGVLMTESEKRDLLSKEHYRNKIAKLQARVEALEVALFKYAGISLAPTEQER